MNILSGVTIIEIAALGPGPFCGMLLADLGADVILVERAVPQGLATDIASAAIFNRGKRSIAIDLKQPRGVEAVLRLIERADGLIEGMRPGVMERLGLGPDICLARNPRLVYGRVTGWGQTGPLAQAAGHDNNYIALSGALWYGGQPGDPPVAPPTLIGDLGGGALYLAVGLLAGILRARSTGRGDVVDAAIVDGSAHLMNLLLALQAGGQMSPERGKGLLDGPHWFATYRCADGRDITIGSLEPQFYAELLDRLDLAGDPRFADGCRPERWPEQKALFRELFSTRPSSEWARRLEGTDVCFAPVLSPAEAARHPHLAARGVYQDVDGVLQAAAAPRFACSPAGRPKAVPVRSEHARDILIGIGLASEEVDALRTAGVIG